MKNFWQSRNLKWWAVGLLFVVCWTPHWLPSHEPGADSGTLSLGSKDGYNFCVALRGNGEKIFSTMASLSRITEHYGLVDAMSGGSSGSIAAFFYESMLLNPELKKCNSQACSADEIKARMGLMLKSFQGYVEYMESQPEVRGILTVTKLKAEMDRLGVAGLDRKDLEIALVGVHDLFKNKEYRDLLNPEIIHLVETWNPAQADARIKRIIQIERTATNTSILNSEMLISPGVANMRQVADSAGLIGDFYAGVKNSEELNQRWQNFFQSCSQKSLGQPWSSLHKSSQCGDLLSQMAKDYQNMRGVDAVSERLQEKVGAHVPTFVSISVLLGADVVQAYTKARAEIQKLKAHQDLKFVPSGDSYHLGYAGQKSHLDVVKANIRKYQDFKTQRFHPMADLTWSEAMYRSISEPGLSRLLDFDESTLTAGGWSDSAPTLVLKNLGCNQVVYVTREGSEDPFSGKIATLLGLSPADKNSLLAAEPLPGVTVPSLGLSLQQSSAVWCTHWNSVKPTDFEQMSNDGYSAPLQVNQPSRFFLDSKDAYPGARRDHHVEGCYSSGLTAD